MFFVVDVEVFDEDSCVVFVEDEDWDVGVLFEEDSCVVVVEDEDCDPVVLVDDPVVFVFVDGEDCCVVVFAEDEDCCVVVVLLEDCCVVGLLELFEPDLLAACASVTPNTSSRKTDNSGRTSTGKTTTAPPSTKDAPQQSPNPRAITPVNLCNRKNIALARGKQVQA